MRKLLAIALLLFPLAAGADDRWPTGNGKLYTQAIFNDTMFYSVQDITLDGIADAANTIDGDNDGVPELFCNVGLNYCAFDVNHDSVADFVVFSNVISFDSGAIRAALGLGVGNGVGSAAQTVSACLGRDSSVDRLFEDKDCDFVSGTVTPETTPTGSTNSEAFITDMQRRLSADVSTDGAGGANDTTGIQATGLKLDLDWIGAYRIEYQILSQSSATGTGLAYGVEYTGTETSLYCVRKFVSDGTTAASGIIDDVANTNTGQLVEGYTANAASTTAPNMGPNAGVATANSTALETIECNLLTSTAGDLTFYFASETDGTAVTIKANSTVRATPFP